MYDIIVIGGGPAGLTAALYGLRANKSVLVIEKATFGGQITFSPKVENIPGFISLTGNEFAEKLVDQVIEQGGEFEAAEVLSVTDGDVKLVKTDSGEFEGKTVIIATGAKHRMLGVEGEHELVGEGISFCAVCDGAFFANKVVGVVGGGNSALQEAILLSDTASKVYVLQNLDRLTGEDKLAKQLENKDNVEIITGVTVDSFITESGSLKGVKIKSAKDGSLTDIALDGLFVAIGLIPQNEPFANVMELNSYGYAEADESCLTKTAGIFTAGDCRSKKVRQVATAAADGAVAALAACNYIDSLE